jgi:hypothetical protein
MDLVGITIITFLLCLIFVEYIVYRIKETEHARARLKEMQGYAPFLERRRKI